MQSFHIDLVATLITVKLSEYWQFFNIVQILKRNHQDNTFSVLL